MAQLCTRSIGLQVSLCQCSSTLGTNATGNNNSGNIFDFSTSICDKSDPEMASSVNDDEAVETKHLLSDENVARTEDARESAMTENVVSNSQSTPPPKQQPSSRVHAGDGESPSQKDVPHHHHFQFKRKFNFRSDSVFSDVLPSSSSQDCQKPAGDSEKSGSLSSLKPKESKWVTLKRKLGKINSSPASTSSKPKPVGLENKLSSKSGNIHEKRSLLQRAKTLSILPTNRLKEGRDELPPKRQPRRPPEMPELFNVGGEIDMIPLELLIDINDLKISK